MHPRMLQLPFAFVQILLDKTGSPFGIDYHRMGPFTPWLLSFLYSPFPGKIYKSMS